MPGYGKYRSPEISIHALRVEGDWIPAKAVHSVSLFLSTPSGWRATTGAHKNFGRN